VFVIERRTPGVVERELVAVADQLERGMARLLELVAEFDRLSGARMMGFRGTAEWLAWRCHLDARTARERVRVARRLAELPETRFAFACGQLSYSKVRAITRASELEDEAALVEAARTSTAAQLETFLRQLPSAPSADPEVERRVYESRYLDWWWDDEGGMQFRGRLPADQAAAVIDVIETAADAIHPPPDHDGPFPRPPLGARRADALAEIMLSGPPTTNLVLHADIGTLCALEGGPAVPAETARRLACDAIVQVAGARPGDGGHRRRFPTPAQRSRVLRRDGHCRFPGCMRRHGLATHHAWHWIDGGPTDDDNLVAVCRFHHRLLHEEGFSVRRCGDEFIFYRPDGSIIPAVPEPAGALPTAQAA
jgi:hypothetical protein